MLEPIETIIEGEGFTAHVLDYGILTQAVSVTYSIPRHEVESHLFRRGCDLRDCEWNFVPNTFTPATYLPDASELPIGRIIHGDGWRASLRYIATGYEAVYIDGPDPGAGIRDLSKRGVTIAPDCIVWRLPTGECVSGRVDEWTSGQVSEAHRKRFWGTLKWRRNVFACFDLDKKRIKRYYCVRFGVISLSALTPVQWAIAAAEVSCMGDNVDILSRRAHEIRMTQGGAI